MERILTYVPEPIQKEAVSAMIWTEAPPDIPTLPNIVLEPRLALPVHETLEKPKTRRESWVMQVHRDFQKAPEDVRAVFNEEKNYFKRISKFRKYQRGELVVPILLKPLIKPPEFKNYWGGTGPENKIVFERALAEIEKNKITAAETNGPTEQPRPEILIERIQAEDIAMNPQQGDERAATKANALFGTMSAGITSLYTKAQSYLMHVLT